MGAATKWRFAEWQKKTWTTPSKEIMSIKLWASNKVAGWRLQTFKID